MALAAATDGAEAPRGMWSRHHVHTGLAPAGRSGHNRHAAFAPPRTAIQTCMMGVRMPGGRSKWLLVLAVLPALLGAERERPPKVENKKWRLELHVPDQSGLYFTAWGNNDGSGTLADVITDKDGSDGKEVVYRRFLIWYDDCTWEATETLKPTSANRYEYTYRENPKSCPRGKTANATTTPRDGHVLVFPLKPDDARPLTPLTAWTPGWEKPKS
jgi:hypothetical protein